MATSTRSYEEMFSYLRDSFSPEKKKPMVDTNVPQLVLFAEHVLKEGYVDLAIQCIDFYLSINPPTNQFFIRAHVCRGMALSNKEGKEQESLRCFSKAVNLAKKWPCYHFLVYNVSLCLWRVVRSKLTSVSSGQPYSTTLQTVVKALDDINNDDYQWRLNLLHLLAQSQICTQFDEAMKTALVILKLVRSHLPSLLIESYRLLVAYGLIGDVKEKDLKSNPELSILIKIWKIRNSGGSDSESRLSKLLLVATKGDSPGKKASPPLPHESLGPVLIELGKASLQYGCVSLAEQCVKMIETAKDKDLNLNKKLLEAQLLLSPTSSDLYTPSNVQIRQDAIKILESVLSELVNSEPINGPMIEEICVQLWNVCLPLLQPTLRSCLLKPLTAVSAALTKIESILRILRIMVYLELVKINTDVDDSQTSLRYIESAKLLDNDGLYTEQLQWLQHRLSLRLDIHSVPQKPLDQAIQKLEQLKSSESVESSEPILVSIGDLLTNGSFSTLLNTGLTLDKYDKVKLFKENVIINNDDQTDKTRCWLWSELSTISRKTGLWDICHLSSLYCLLYDDQRWKYKEPSTQQIPGKKSKESTRSKKVESATSVNTPEHIVPSTESLLSLTYNTPTPATRNKEMLLLLGQAHCIYGEVLVHALQCEGIGLGQTPSTNNNNNETSSDEWTSYCNWISMLTEEAQKSFLRGAEIGSSIEENWLTHNSAVYMWNYHREHLSKGVHSTTSVLTVFRRLYQLLEGNQDSVSLACNIGTVVVNGLVTKWIPQPTPRTGRSGSTNVSKKGGGGGGRGSSRSKKKDVVGGVDPDATNDIKDAVTVCESLFSKISKHSMSFSVCCPLLKAWVLAKFLYQSPLPSGLVPFDIEGYKSNCQATVGVEMYRLMSQFTFYEFPNPPSFDDIMKFITQSVWPDPCSPVELYTQLATSASVYQYPDVVKGCCQKALELDGDKLLLSTASCLLGQYTSNDPLAALDCYRKSSRFASEGGSYDKVIHAIRSAWNVSLTLIGQEKTRGGLFLPFKEMLNDVMKLAGRRVETPATISEGDIKLLSGMYHGLFQICTDKNAWVEGLEMLESALWASPKAFHQILMKYKILFKSRLGGVVDGEMLRYQEELGVESEEEDLSRLWFEVGLNSKGEKPKECFEKAIELFKEDGDSMHKLQYVTELSRWLYHNGYPHSDVLTQLSGGIKLCPTDTVQGLDLLLQFNVMCSQCSLSDQLGYCLKATACVVKIMKEVASFQTMEEWSNLTLSDELVSHITKGTKDDVPSVTTITRPLLTVHYLDVLLETLLFHLLHLMTFPVLQLLTLIAKHIICSQPLHQLYQLKMAVICQELRMSNSPLVYSLDSRDIAECRYESMNGESFATDCISDRVCVWQVLTKIAFIMLDQGQYQNARELLCEAKIACQSTGDSSTLAHVLLGEAKLLIFERNYNGAIEKLLEGQKLSCSYSVWLGIIDSLCEVITRKGEEEEKEEEEQLKMILNKALSVAETVLREEPLKVVTSLLHIRLELLKQTRDIAHIQSNISTLMEYGCIGTVVNSLLSLSKERRRRRGRRSKARGEGEVGRDLMDSISLARQAVAVLQEWHQEIITLTSPSPAIVMPTQQKLIEAQIHLAEMLLSVVMETAERKNKLKTQMLQKSSIEKLIDDFVHVPPPLSVEEELWEETVRLATSEGLALLIDTYNQSDQCLQVKCLCRVGLFLIEVSNEVCPDVLESWIVSLPPGVLGKEKSDLMSSLSLIMRQEEADKAMMAESVSRSRLSWGGECLMSAIAKGLKTQQLDLVQSCALKLVEAYGLFDPVLASTYLALYQSCSSSLSLSSLLEKCLPLPEKCQLSTLLQQHHVLPHHLPSSTATLKTLQQNYESWRRLSVSEQHLDLLKSFHCDTRLIVLQHSSNSECLYSAYLIPPQPPPPAPKRGQPPVEYDPLVPAIGRSTVRPKDLASLRQLLKDYKSDIAHSCHYNSKNEESLQMQFEGLMAALEAYISQSIAHLMPAIEKDGNKELTVVLLVDFQLEEFPLEALSFVRKMNTKSLSRDFSLQMLHHRLKGMTAEQEAVEEDKKKSNVDKYQAQPSSYMTNINNFRYIIDPRNDLDQSGNEIQNIKSVISDYAKLTGKWTGAYGMDHPLSHGEWSPVLLNASGLLFLTSEKFLNHFPPSYLSPLNLPGLGFAAVVDLLSSTTSFQIQSKIDSEKSKTMKNLEEPAVLVKLLSLSGANCIYSHQWKETTQKGINKFKALLKDILSKPTTTGQLCVRNGEEGSASYSSFNAVIYGLPNITFLAETN